MKTMLVIVTCLLHLNLFAADLEKKKLDVIFVVDNSGSMYQIQQRLARSLTPFLSILRNHSEKIDWKIGLISTSDNEEPYLGFQNELSADSFGGDSYQQDMSFYNAVSSLGTSGSATEMSVYNIERVLKTYPTFFRENADLAVVTVSDEDDQSVDKFGDAYESENFLSSLRADDLTEDQKVRFYGVLSFPDIQGCENGPDYNGNYEGSNYSEIIQITKGLTIPACSDDLKEDMAFIAYNMMAMVLFE